MKQFFYSFLGTIAGLFVTIIILFFILFGLVFSVISASSDEKPLKVKNNSILHIKLDRPITERTPKNPFANFDITSLDDKAGIGLNDILANIKKAKTDENIKGIYLEAENIEGGIASVEEIRNALLDFKKESKKFIISYSETYSQKAYYLASVADKIYLHPQGLIEFKGLAAQVMFYKNLLEKLDVDVQIFRHGKFKSAIEPYDLDKMSPANRQQTMTYIGSIWNYMLDGISKSRSINVGELNRMADEMLIRNAPSTVKYKLADELKYKDEVIAMLKSKTGTNEKDKLNLTAIGDYTRSPGKAKGKFIKEKIAVIYAVGDINSGEGDDQEIGSDRISEAIREARMDSAVKAIVLRVNSPGGSALASDVIWREVVLAKNTKPVIVSMGDVAASGGYYIACAADAIVAQPNTITGSIGVFGLLPNAQKFFSNKLGITVDTVKTNKHSDIGSIYRPVSPEEGKVIQNAVEEIYTDFITKVGKGRNMTPANVDSIGQGRVWSGVDAKRIGLVNELGGIETALAMAAKKVNLTDYTLISLPKQKDPFEELIQDLTGGIKMRFLKNELGPEYDYYEKLKNASTQKGVQARMVYDVIIN